jgi:peptidoglycan hydrolase-like protein with peptidoglycan-binding domain/lysophospholipase L1-like esterase
MRSKYNMITCLIAILALFVAVYSPLLSHAQVSSSGSCSFERTLRFGSRGDDVRMLQIILNTNTLTAVALDGQGSAGSETSFFGRATEAAVSRFQDLYEDDVLAPFGISRGNGIAGNLTLKKIGSLCKASESTVGTAARSLSVGAMGPDVVALQDVLRQGGYFEFGSTGYFGQATLRAVLRFQRENGIPQVGIVGPLTRKSLSLSAPSTLSTQVASAQVVRKRSSPPSRGVAPYVQSQQAPIVSVPSMGTGSVSSITQDGAVVFGSVVSNNNAVVTIRGFEYGTTTAYGQVSSSTGSFAPGVFSESLSGLDPSTTYHYRAFATNEAGTAVSADSTFVTDPLPLAMPSGALGIWYMDQYDSTYAPVVPNAISTMPVSKNLFRGGRRILGSSQLWNRLGLTVTEGVDTCPDGSSEATRLFSTGDFYINPINDTPLDAGTYTVAASVKSNAGTDQFFKMAFFGAGEVSDTFTATSTWQRVSYTATVPTLSNAFVMPFISFDRSTGTDLHVCDLALYEGSVDIGEPQLSGHLYLGSTATANLPTFADGALNFAGGAYGAIQFASSTSIASTTAIAFAYRQGDGSEYQPFLSKVQSHVDFSAFLEREKMSEFMFGGQQFSDAQQSRGLMSGWHMVTNLHTGTTTQVWRDDVKLLTVGRTAGPVSLSDLFVSNLAGFSSNYKIAAVALYPRALTDTEVRDAYAYLSERIATSGNSPASLSKVVVAEGDSISNGPGAYPALYAADATTTQVTTYAVSGSFIGTLNARAARVDETIPPVRGSRKLIISVFIGANDLPAYDTSTVSTFLSDLSGYLDARRAAGFQVAVATILPRDSVGFEAVRNVANSVIRTWAGTHADEIIDFAADPNMGCAGCELNATYFADGLHPTPAGQAILKTIYASVIDAM